jgi:hypothetical protein
MDASGTVGPHMQIPPPSTRVTVPTPQPAAVAWQSGQRLEATVITRAAAPGGATEVRIGELRLTLNLPAAVTAGGRLQLEVVRAGAQPVLRLLSFTPAATGGASAAVGRAGAPAALARLLPIQGSQAPLLAALSAAARDPAAVAGLPRDLQAAILQIIERIPTLAQALQPATLRQAIHSSGLFYEAILAQLVAGMQPPARPEGDLKAALLSLAVRLRTGSEAPVPVPKPRGRDARPPGPGSGPIAQGRLSAAVAGAAAPPVAEGLRAASEQALARLVLHQWSAVENAESGQGRWLLELPLRSGDGIDIIHLLLERERGREAPEQEPAWNVELALDLPELGPVHLRITIAGDQVGTRVWAQETATVTRVNAALPELRAALEDRRLRVRDLGCHHGAPPQSIRPSVDPRPILDDRA